jgi:hypothetical protein
MDTPADPVETQFPVDPAWPGPVVEAALVYTQAYGAACAIQNLKFSRAVSSAVRQAADVSIGIARGEAVRKLLDAWGALKAALAAAGLPLPADMPEP